ncbi:ABC transporter ATP-binding protein [Aureibacter tunicatorum]|uniref:Iron complex transport system ATP-binding protein n=1 Tax=Aureibacter tunicatorum TaxID=866807 RepID=A0AAE3XU82_9BACT|nr:ABC transporter ATP-binding protein [Aureibacter tunicatorum]MDR6242054.1 iron complex transport system ATP-binding protein [Aureibacter tunicatorum]BDD03629.1 iron(III) ABC transporter ATP-binding protein [Aureibacter tunicatorum]
MLRTLDLGVGYIIKGKKENVLGGLDLNLGRSELCTLIGPNGIGKSTLMRTISGVQKPLTGHVEIDGQDVLALSAVEKSKILSVVFADRPNALNMTVRELANIGRAPYTNWMGMLSARDKFAVENALECTKLSELANRKLYTLSDGQKQRAMIARALAQDTPVMLLDEPTAHLDLPNRIELFELLGKIASDNEKSILVSSHELDLAIQFSDRIWMADHSRAVCEGIPEDLIWRKDIEGLFDNESIVFNYQAGRFEFNRKEKDFSVCVKGDEQTRKWVEHALIRIGVAIVDQPTENGLEIDCQESLIDLKCKNRTFSFDNIEKVLVQIKLLMNNK